MATRKKGSGSGGSRNRRSTRRRSGGRRLWWVILILILLLAGGWYFGTPYWTLHQMREAVKHRDSAALAAYIDMPALRKNLSGQMRAKLDAEAHKEEGFGALGAILGHAMLDPLLDRMISPDSLQAMLSGVSLTGGKAKSTALQSKHNEISHDGLTTFRVHNPKRATGDGDLVFQWEGLGWKLVAIDLPGMNKAEEADEE